MKSNKSKRVKMLRGIVGGVFAVLGVVLIAGVCLEWHRQGCGWESLVLAVVFYGGCMSGFWFATDQTIKEIVERWSSFNQ